MPDVNDDVRWMRRAIALARRGLGRVEPNPMVGAVIVRGGREVASGYHARFGGAHAEVRALQGLLDAGAGAEGCEMYVTLEPCCHEGKTGPCTDTIVRSGIRRVHVAMPDPFEQVSGGGIEALRRSGVEVRVGLCGGEAADLNEAYLKRVTRGLPWVIAKWAQAVDGRIATRGGRSKWLSGEGSRRWVHRLRARVDAVLVGIGTVLADDPLLTARRVRVHRRARRAVVDPSLRLPLDGRLLASLADGSGPPVVVGCATGAAEQRRDRVAALRDRGVEVVELPAREGGGGRLAIEPLLRRLVRSYDATNVLVEGGSVLLGSMLGEGLIDQAAVFVTPRVMGDGQAIPAAVGNVVPTLERATGLRLRGVKRVGEDVLLDYSVVGRGAVAGGDGG